jgi:hypothetical protein
MPDICVYSPATSSLLAWSVLSVCFTTHMLTNGYSPKTQLLIFASHFSLCKPFINYVLKDAGEGLEDHYTNIKAQWHLGKKEAESAGLGSQRNLPKEARYPQEITGRTLKLNKYLPNVKRHISNVLAEHTDQTQN